MTEYGPESEESFKYTGIIKSGDVKNLPVDSKLVKEIFESLTPNEILNGTDFERPEAIHPLKYPDFASLKRNAVRIRTLKLVPVKSDEDYIKYHAQPKEELFKTVLSYLEGSELTLALNLFPYYLPKDLEQYIIWVKDPGCSRVEISRFVARILSLLQLSLDEVILFERPMNTKSLLVRGTFPEVRHLHFWAKK